MLEQLIERILPTIIAALELVFYLAPLARYLFIGTDKPIVTTHQGAPDKDDNSKKDKQDFFHRFPTLSN